MDLAVLMTISHLSTIPFLRHRHRRRLLKTISLRRILESRLTLPPDLIEGFVTSGISNARPLTDVERVANTPE